ncbi:MAG: hypothetical protein EOP81_14230 [Variovorax sp.]|nr:MAG: hypothetical protein EOP81_14230 [Variovorax sp.]
MLLQILQHTPTWVFGLFALLLWLGGRQLRAGRTALWRVGLLPVAMTGLSIYGVGSAFGSAPAPLAAWAAAAALTAAWVLRRPTPAGTRYDAATRSFAHAGSAVPLLLMMGIFFAKYAVAVQLAMHPALVHHAAFTVAIGTLYGAFSGIFAARALRLWKLALRPAADLRAARPA